MKLTFTKQSITSDLSSLMIDAAVTKAREINVPISIAILDEAGHLKAFTRMDGALLVSLESAQDKAYSGLIGLPSHELHGFIKDTPETLIGIPRLPRVTVLGGGFPIKIGDNIIGGIGVGGGSQEQDIEVAKAALAVLEKSA